MKWMIDNWFLIVILGVMFCFVGASILSFSKLTKKRNFTASKNGLNLQYVKQKKH